MSTVKKVMEEKKKKEEMGKREKDKTKSNQGQLQPQRKRTWCQHMQRVKSLRKGWVFGWQGTRDGKIYHLPENPDAGFYKLIDPNLNP